MSSKIDGSDHPYQPYHPYEIGTVCITKNTRTVTGPGLFMTCPDQDIAEKFASVAKSAYEAGKQDSKTRDEVFDQRPYADRTENARY